VDLELVTGYAAGGKSVRCVQQHLHAPEGTRLWMRHETGPDGEWREKPDHRWSNDWRPACRACANRNAPASVKCPRLHGAAVANIPRKSFR
jgi:hypothetical protein